MNLHAETKRTEKQSSRAPRRRSDRHFGVQPALQSLSLSSVPMLDFIRSHSGYDHRFLLRGASPASFKSPPAGLLLVWTLDSVVLVHDPSFPVKAVLHTQLEPGPSPHQLSFPLIDFQIQTEDAGLFHRTCIDPLAILPHNVRSTIRFAAKRPIRKP